MNEYELEQWNTTAPLPPNFEALPGYEVDPTQLQPQQDIPSFEPNTRPNVKGSPPPPQTQFPGGPYSRLINSNYRNPDFAPGQVGEGYTQGAANTIVGVGQMIASPIDTSKAIYDVAENYYDHPEQIPEDLKGYVGRLNDGPRAVGQFFGEYAPIIPPAFKTAKQGYDKLMKNRAGNQALDYVQSQQPNQQAPLHDYSNLPEIPHYPEAEAWKKLADEIKQNQTPSGWDKAGEPGYMPKTPDKIDLPEGPTGSTTPPPSGLPELTLNDPLQSLEKAIADGDVSKIEQAKEAFNKAAQELFPEHHVSPEGYHVTPFGEQLGVPELGGLTAPGTGVSPHRKAPGGFDDVPNDPADSYLIDEGAPHPYEHFLHEPKSPEGLNTHHDNWDESILNHAEEFKDKGQYIPLRGKYDKP